MSIDTDQHIAELTELRHRLHSIAEISGRERKTARCIEDFLRKTEPDELISGVGGNGILARYDGKDEGAELLLRCELDALPIPDRVENVDYRSESDGVGHKCGHDGHMAIICGVAKELSKKRPQKGTVWLLFQPSEETGEGATRVLQDTKFEAVDPDYCFALHNLPGFSKHQVIVKDDVFASASVGLIVNLHGSSSHAAHPEQGNSPALAVAHLINAYSAAPQFKIPLEEAAKVTIVHAKVGERAFGTSPAEASVMATLRTYDEVQLEILRDHCLQVARGIAETHRLQFNHEFVEPFPVTANHDEAIAAVRTSAAELGLSIYEKQEPFGWSEDFGHYTQKYKGALFGLGIGEDHPSLHDESYDFPDEVIPTGVQVFMKIIKTLT